MRSVVNGWWVSGSPSEFARPISSPLSSTTIASALGPVVGIAAGALAPELTLLKCGSAKGFGNYTLLLRCNLSYPGGEGLPKLPPPIRPERSSPIGVAEGARDAAERSRRGESLKPLAEAVPDLHEKHSSALHHLATEART